MANWRCSCGNTNHEKSKKCLACGNDRPAQPAGGNPNPAPAGNPAPQGGQPAPKKKEHFQLEANATRKGDGLYQIVAQYTDDGKGEQIDLILLGLLEGDVVTDSAGQVVDASKPFATDPKGHWMATVQIGSEHGKRVRRVFFRVVGNQVDTAKKPAVLYPPSFKADRRGFLKNVGALIAHNRGK